MPRAGARTVHVRCRGLAAARLPIALALLLVGAPDPVVAARPGPLVLIVVDTLRADHLPCYGYGRPTAPAMCALAREGVQFDRAFTPRTATTPAIASIFTGLYPHRHGVRDLYLLLPSEMNTLAEILRAQGYRTGGFVSSFVMINDFNGLGQGFETYDDDVRTPEINRENFQRAAGETVDRALHWLAQAGPETFLFIHLIEPHGPYTPPSPYLEQFALPATGTPAPEQISDYQRIAGLTFVNEYVGRYDGEIAAADAAIARVVSFLRGHKWYDPATIVVVADHGESMGEEGQWFMHGHSVNDAEAQVPLIIKFAAARDAPAAGTHVAAPVSHVDLLPTLLAAAGVALPGGFAGTDLRPIAAGAARALPPPLTELRAFGGFFVVAHGPACTMRWFLPVARLTPDLRVPDPAAAPHWTELSAGVRLFPTDASAACGAALATAVKPLATDLFTFHLETPVVSREAVKQPGGKSAFMAARQRQSVPLSESDREALRQLGYLK